MNAPVKIFCPVCTASQFPDYARVSHGLLLHNYAIVDNFLGVRKSQALRTQLMQMHKEGWMQAGETVKADGVKLRSDSVVYLQVCAHNNVCVRAQMTFFDCIRSLGIWSWLGGVYLYAASAFGLSSLGEKI